MNQPDGRKKLIEHVAPARREFVSRLLDGGAFVVPLITTFSIDGSRTVWTARQAAPDPGSDAQA